MLGPARPDSSWLMNDWLTPTAAASWIMVILRPVRTRRTAAPMERFSSVDFGAGRRAMGGAVVGAGAADGPVDRSASAAGSAAVVADHGGRGRRHLEPDQLGGGQRHRVVGGHRADGFGAVLHGVHLGELAHH